ncbi:MAG: Stk1 family PASTA domain-containing Ser/Thr kinase [Pseudonocardia sp.]
MTTPRLLSERYELGEVLGYGGMSEVHRGLDTRLGRDVAVKVLRADLARDPQFQMRFRREAQNAAALNHPAIVAVYDTGEVGSEFGPLPYIVMEYVEGQTLREIVKSTGPMSQRQVIEVMADVCAALDFSHRHQIIHRDVKPANIMINQAGAVKVMDFGIARALGEGQNVTQTAAVIGTAQYLSPEQARGEPVDARSDVYAAGCVLFELLTGEPPFTGDTPVAVAYQHVREDPRHPSEVNPAVPVALDAVVLKALSKNPANRYQSAAEMRTDLVRVRSGQNPMAPVVMSEDERTALLAIGAGPTRRVNGGRSSAPPVPVAEWEDEPRRSGGRTAVIAAAVAAALGLIAFVGYVVLSGPPAPAQVPIPNVIGQLQEAARTQVLNVGLLADPQPVESTVEEKGRVVRTDPVVSSQVAERTRVTLFVGAGPAQARVPQLAGLTTVDAKRELASEGLSLGEETIEETADANLVGKIIRSAPGAGETAPGASAVAVVVGTEQTSVQVPDVSGQTILLAQETLRAIGLKAQVTDGGSTNVVVRTSPAAGQRVPPGSVVTLQTTAGERNEVPNVVGEDFRDAARFLADEGFRAVLIPRGTNDESEDGIVLEQSPEGGQPADTSESITLFVGRSGNNGGN